MQIEDGVEKGLSDSAIGALIGCSANAVNIARKRHGLPSRRKALFSARAVADRLGLSCSKVVTKWIGRGWLRGRRGQRQGPYRQWYVTEDALLKFLEDPRGWPAWNPERIRDRFLREWATEVRTARYLRPGDVASRYAVGVGAVNDWIHRGILPAQRWGNWWIREDDLKTFTPPCEQVRRLENVRRFASWEDERLIGMRMAGQTWTAISESLNRSVSSVFGRYQRLCCMTPESIPGREGVI